jgi:DNA-binding XRE family transcriptional regulator
MATQTGQSRHARRRSRQKNLELVALRVNEGLSREALGYRAGISRETVRLVEDGFVPTPRIQFAIAKVFGLRPLDLWSIESQKAAR